MWYFIDTGEKSAAWNMAFDEVLCETAEEDSDFLLLRLYEWKPWSVSIGYGQNARQTLHSRIKEQGIGIVRRATGGRAVFHANEITYSVIANTSCSLIGNTLQETYAIIGSALLRSLELAGFSGLSLARPSAQDSARGMSARPCFSSVSRSEILWSGRKLIGSAQKRTRNTVLQHGSIPLGPEYRQIAALCGGDEEKGIEYEQELNTRSVCLDEVGPVPSRPVLIESFKTGFVNVWGSDLEIFQCTPSLLQRIEGLAKDKYGSDHWTFRF